MYDGFSDKCAHFAEWFKITKGFLNLAFADGHHEMSCPCNRCENKRMLSEYEMSTHLAKKGFISNYLV
jgi:prepilin-type processing-associated H-X9-DG protein